MIAATATPGAAQGGRGGVARQAASPREAAPVDLTGYWVSVVSEDWRFRIATPRAGDIGGVPLNADGRKVAGAWDPARDAASGDECRSYGAAGLMRVPGRLHITWQDDDTLKLEMDAGRQVRLLHLGRSHQPPTDASWQGDTVASWDGMAGRGAGTGPRWASLRAVTTRLRAGYLRRNGVPYSQDAVLTEYFDRHSAPDGSEWITVTSIVLDPTYLTQEFITSTDFKKEPNGAKWNPTPCEPT
jgi:hypothetical protein